MALRPTALVSVAAAKGYCGVESATTTWDTVLETIIDGVSEGFNRFCDRVLAKATHTSIYLDGPERRDLILPNFPVISITSIYEDDVELTEGADYDYRLYADEGILRRVGGNWAQGDKVIKITYVAGYIAIPISPEVENIPADLKLAVLWQIAAEWMAHKNKTWGKTSESKPDGSSVTRYETTQLLKEVREVLRNGYKRI